MSKQRTSKFVTKILRKTCSSLVKIISDGENNFTQNKYLITAREYYTVISQLHSFWLILGIKQIIKRRKKTSKYVEQ